MTTIRSETWRTTLRSWATNTYDRWNSSWSSSSRLITCAWIETSSAETGSSSRISCGFDGQRARDSDPLALAAGELVRESGPGARDAARRARAADGSRPRSGPCARPGSAAAWPGSGRRACAGSAMPAGPGRPSASRAGSAPAASCAAFVMSLPRKRMLAAGRVDQPHERADQRRLAAARLADDPERLALPRAKRDVVDGVDLPDLAVDDQPRLDREQHLEVIDLEQLRRRCAAPRVSAAGPVSAGGAVSAPGASSDEPPTLTRSPSRRRPARSDRRPAADAASARPRASSDRDGPGASARRAASSGTSRQRSNSCGQRGRK